MPKTQVIIMKAESGSFIIITIYQPVCEHFGVCGGCCNMKYWQFMLKLKNHLQNALENWTPEFEAILGSKKLFLPQ
jgi:hypothetical protein